MGTFTDHPFPPLDLRRASTASNVAAVAAPVLIATAELITPINDASDSSADRVADILDHSGQYALSVLCLLAGMLLMVPAVVGLRRTILSPAGRHLGAAGATFAGAGFMLFAVASGALGVGPSAWSGIDDRHRGVLVEAFGAMDQGRGAMPLVQWGPIVALMGLTVLSVRLWRYATYPRWASVALTSGWAMFLFAPTHAARAGGALALLVGFMPMVHPSRTGPLV